jgi:hypothetical protein
MYDFRYQRVYRRVHKGVLYCIRNNKDTINVSRGENLYINCRERVLYYVLAYILSIVLLLCVIW